MKPQITDEFKPFDVANPLELSKGTDGQIFDAKGGINSIFKYLEEKGLLTKAILTFQTKGVLCKEVAEMPKVPQLQSIATTQSFSLGVQKGG